MSEIEGKCESTIMTKAEYARAIGVTVPTIDGWIRRYWKKGLHYGVKGHNTFVSVAEADRWAIEDGQQESGQTATASRSESTGTGMKLSNRSKATRTMRVTSPARLNAEKALSHG